MKRREFITLLGGAAVWSLPVGAQQSERMRCIGVLMSLAADDSETQARHAAFLQGLQQLGWIDGRNATGFSVFEYSMSGKWLELIREIVPGVKRVAVIRDPSISAGPAQFAAIQAVAPSFGVELSPLGGAMLPRSKTQLVHSHEGRMAA